MEKYIIPFVISFSISTIAIFFLLRSRFLRSDLKKRLGGALMILVFAGLVLFDQNLVITKQISGILIGGALILFFGLWDDLKNLSWKRQLLFQIIVAIVAISLGVKSDHVINPLGGVINLSDPAVYFIFFIFYFLFFMNSLNWLDGVDGLAGSVTLVALAVIFFLSLLPHVNQPAVAILCSIAGGTIAGFLFFNWHPAKIMAGTSGAWFFGFLLASLSIFAGAKIATVLIAALIPVLDFANVIWERLRAGKSIFSGGDNRHLHHKLLKLGLSAKQVVSLLFLASAGIGAAALSLGAVGKAIFIIAFSIFYFSMIRLLNSNVHKS